MPWLTRPTATRASPPDPVEHTGGPHPRRPGYEPLPRTRGSHGRALPFALHALDRQQRPSCSHSVRMARTAADRVNRVTSSFMRSGARSVSSRSGTSPSPTPFARIRKPSPRSTATASSSAWCGMCVYGGPTSTVTSQGSRPASCTAPRRAARTPRSARVPANTLTCSGSSVSVRAAARTANAARLPSSSGSRRACARTSPVSGRARISSAATPPVVRLTTGWKAKRRVSLQEGTGA